MSNIEKKDAKDAKKLEFRQALPSQFVSGEFARNLWNHVPEYGTTRENLMQPEYWAILAPQMRIADRVEVMSEDGSWYAELLVRNVSQGAVSVGLLNYREFEVIAENELELEGMRIAFRGRSRMWIVQRISDNHVLREGLKDRGEALHFATMQKRVAA